MRVTGVALSPWITIKVITQAIVVRITTCCSLAGLAWAPTRVATSKMAVTALTPTNPRKLRDRMLTSRGFAVASTRTVG